MSYQTTVKQRPIQYSIAALLLLILACTLYCAFIKWVSDRHGKLVQDRAGAQPWELVECSPNGTFRFEAKGAIGDSYYSDYAVDVAYSLYRGASQDPIWKLKLRPDATIPINAFVHDQGWVVTRDRHRLTVFTPAGKVAFQGYLEGDVIPLQELELYVRWESVPLGYLWSGRSHWYFVDLDDTPYFSIRTWWGRRIAVDLRAGKIVKLEAPLREAAEEAEKQLALDALEHAAEIVAKDRPLSESDNEHLRRVADAAHLASCIDLKEAIPLLEKLEPVDLQECWSSIGEELDAMASRTRLPDGIPPFSYGTNELRRSVQLALRRLGARPAGYAATSFEIREGDSKRQMFVPSARFPAREHSVGRVKKDMKPIDVLEALGPPDYVRSGESWEYDIDAAEPYTLSIVWENRRVAEVESETPPAWQHGLERDRPSSW